MPNLNVGLLYKFRNVSYLLGHPVDILNVIEKSIDLQWINDKSQKRGVIILFIYPTVLVVYLLTRSTSGSEVKVVAVLSPPI